MLQSRHQKPARRKGNRKVQARSMPFVLLAIVALGGMAYGAGRGDWVIVALNAVTASVAIWGLRPHHAPSTAADHTPATSSPTDCPSGTHPSPQPKATSSPAHAQPLPQSAAADSTTTPAPAPAPAQLPVVGSFAITGRIGRTATGAAAGLAVILPSDTEVTTIPVVAALLTTGHRILAEHDLTHWPLPEVEVTAVERTAEPPARTSGTGFTVHVTNDPTTCSSEITVEANQLPGTGYGVQLIAATLLAGAEHLLEGPDQPFRPRATPTHQRGGRPRQHGHSPAFR
jgi:hypothetical protein